MTDLPIDRTSKTMLGVNPRELHSWRSAECGGACERVYKADDVDAEIERLREALERIDAHLEVRPDSELGQLQVISHNHSFGFWLALKAAREVLRNERKPFETYEHEWVIVYADQARMVEHFSGAGADAAARGRFEQLKMAWTCRLFQCVDKTGYGPSVKANEHSPDPAYCSQCGQEDRDCYCDPSTPSENGNGDQT